ncbi:hypothetical protein [Streptomyces phaeochromogenes]|uniref:hypothetical protein n=1 Tax=Streptomyces phaeochromogenes TaxID=1923 RepID=UPI002E10C887|nr:hypothetical protein OG437_41150 [Streptomyces phaeochromogenes]
MMELQPSEETVRTEPHSAYGRLRERAGQHREQAAHRRGTEPTGQVAQGLAVGRATFSPSRTLGINITVTVKWQRVAASDWCAYAGEISRRLASEQFSSRHAVKEHKREYGEGLDL